MRPPHGFRGRWTPEAEANISGLPLSDVLDERARADALRQREIHAAAYAGRMIADAIAEMDRAGQVPEEFERREEPDAPGYGRRWRDHGPMICPPCRGSGAARHGGACWRCRGSGEA